LLGHKSGDEGFESTQGGKGDVQGGAPRRNTDKDSREPASGLVDRGRELGAQRPGERGGAAESGACGAEAGDKWAAAGAKGGAEIGRAKGRRIRGKRGADAVDDGSGELVDGLGGVGGKFD
jgi:hypothetical protein